MVSRISNTVKSPSAAVALILSVGIVIFRAMYPPVNILSWDVFGYYLYLPAGFIYHDLRLTDISWVDQLIAHYQTTSTFYQATRLDAGGWVLKYPMGLALMNLPGFAVARLVCAFTAFPADGFSLPYQYAWAATGLLFSAAGIFMLRRILRLYFSEPVTSITLVLTVLGTNYFQLTAFEGFLSHNFLFTLYTFIVWYTLQWHKKPGYSAAAGIGFFVGLAVLSRPSEMVAALIPLLWGVYNLQSMKQKAALVLAKSGQLAVLLAAGLLAVVPQLIYWRYATGHWIYYSYNNAGEGFELLRPYLWQVLFSFRKGWLVYTPIMLFALAGFVCLYRRNKPLFLPILVYFAVNLWVVSSWTCWWYAGGSYSQRALLSSYVLLALPLGYFLQWVSAGKMTVKVLLTVILALMLILNLFQTWQWVHGVIDRTRMTKDYYVAVFGKTAATPADRSKLLIERPTGEKEMLLDESDYTKREALYLDFESFAGDNSLLSRDTVFQGSHALRLDQAHPFSPGLEMTFSQITAKDHAWIRAEVMVYPVAAPGPQSASLVITFQHGSESYHYRAVSISDPEFSMKPSRWKRMQLDYLTPEVRSAADVCKAYFWLQGSEPVLIDNLKITIFEPQQ